MFKSTIKPSAEILRYSLTSFAFKSAFRLVRLVISYVNFLSSFKTTTKYHIIAYYICIINMIKIEIFLHKLSSNH